MAELALYRKYRGKSFAEILGQTHIVTTLTNALANGRISHAYLFTGPRGVGKTSVARLLARAVNCLESQTNMPCNSCQICLVPLASNMDIIEIDAASNRRIDEVRDLRDKINLSPALSRYKVYIIDEVHMLTNEAFNALLKTLEEPPTHAIFILATTEAHKLPETIISRTQRFNFKAITPKDLSEHLGKIAKKEGITIEPDAINLIVEASHGSFRDAISMLDQVSGSGQDLVTAQNVNSLLGLSDSAAIEKLVLSIAQRQPGEAIRTIDELVDSGAQISELVMQLMKRWREIMLSKLTTTKITLASSVAELSESQIANIINLLSNVLTSPMPEIALETTLVELSSATPAKVPQTTSAPKNSPEPTPTEVSLPTIKEPLASDNASMQTLWPKVLVLIKVENNSLYALLCSCRIAIETDQIIINCRFSFHRDRIEEPKNRAIIEVALAKVYNKPVRAVSQLEALGVPEQAIDPTNELVSSALEILGGEVVND